MEYKLVRMCVLNHATGQREYRWYAREVIMGTSTTEMIADAITEKTSFTQTDVLGNLDAYWRDIDQRLQQGQIVQAGPLGHFVLRIENFGGTANKADWTPSLIKRAKISFIPTKTMRQIAQGATFHRWSGDTDAVSAKLHGLQEKVFDAEADLAAAMHARDRFRKAAAAHPEDVSNAAALMSAEAMVEADTIILEEAKKKLAELKIKAHEGLADLAALGIYFDDLEDETAEPTVGE